MTTQVTIDPDMGIVLGDGTRLSARVWRPDGAGPLPAILEYLPYRKSDFTAARDHPMHQYYAENGYVAVRVDRRGCGDSEGLFDDEYSEQELSDGVEIITWIAAQDWCDGNVGIQGISWGGFNGLQLAARAPEALKAVISIGTTVDRFADDIHFKGGVMLSENIGWAANMMPRLALPPDPAIVGGKWRDMWIERLENMAFLAPDWLGRQTRDDYWKHGSICEDYSALKAPVWGIGGQHDGYRNAPAALVANLSCPVKGMLGPWSHKYPHISTIGPSIDFLPMAVQWWDRWLKGRDTGVEDWPDYSAYVMDSLRADPGLDHRPGGWIGTDWPGERTAWDLPFGNGVLGVAGEFSAKIHTDMACGRAAGEYFPFGFGPGELPDDQTPDDALSACFDSAPTHADQIILGAPELGLTVASTATCGQVIARLCDLRPDGTSTLICLGVLNLRRRGGHGQAQDLEAGKPYDIRMMLDQAAYRLPKGHRLRLAISPSYWPYVWPEGEAYALTLTGGHLSVPTHPAGHGEMPDFDLPQDLPQRQYNTQRVGPEEKTWSEADGVISLDIFGDAGRLEDIETGLVMENIMSEHWEIRRDDPASAKAHLTWDKTLARGDWSVRIRAVAKMAGLADRFEVVQTLTAWEGDAQVFVRDFEVTIPRK